MNTATETAEDKLANARTALALKGRFCFFMSTLFRLRFVAEEKPDFVMSTDGQSIFYCPSAVERMISDDVVVVLLHELAHVLLLHPYRGQLLLNVGHDPTGFELIARLNQPLVNLAMDYVVNGLLVEMGVTLLDSDAVARAFGRTLQKGQSCGMPYNKKYTGWSVEEVYEDLKQSATPISLSMDIGECLPAPGDATEQQTRGQRDMATTIHALQQAQQQVHATQAGKLPALLERLLGQWTKTTVDYREFIMQFVERCAEREFSWKVPNRRMLAHDLWLPSLQGEELGPICFMVDTSGSISADNLADMAGVMNRIIEEFQPRETHVGYCDAEVHRYEVYEKGEAITLKPVGGGGTDFRPAFEYVTKLDNPLCLIYLTDLYGEFPDPATVTIPTLWISTTPDLSAPFGETIYLEGE